MKPKALTEHDEGMLEFLEDIIGTSQYKEPIAELWDKVENLNEIRGQKLNRARAVEKEKDSLEGAKNEAEHYLSLKKEAALKQYTLYERYKYDCSELEAKAKEKETELADRIKEVDDSGKKYREGKEEKLKEQKKLYKEYDRLCKSNDKLKSELTACEQRDTRLRQDLKNGSSQLKKTKKLLEKEREKLQDFEATPERSEREIKESETKLKILQKRKEEEEEKMSAVMASLKDDTKHLQEEKEELEKELVVLSQKSNQEKSKFDIAQSELELYQETFATLKNQLSEVKEQLSSMKTTSKDKENELKRLTKALPGLKSELIQTEREYESVSNNNERTNQSLISVRSQLEEAKSSLEAHKNRGRVLEALMEQKMSGRIPGIVGRLGDLGSIDDKYDVAISTACSSLDHVVVETIDTAVTCVEFLKKNNIGSTTFIGLDKMDKWRQRATTPIETPENVPRLFDLVKVKDDRYLTAFYYALTDTLVANDLDQATRIALQGRKRYRVVTLGGQLIDSSGTMSGGGNKVMKGRMSSKLASDVTPSQLQQLEQKLNQEEKESIVLSQRKEVLGTRIRELKKEITKMEKDIKTIERELEVLKEKEKGLNVRLVELEEKNSNTHIDPKREKELEKQAAKFCKEYEAAAANTSEVDQKVKILHEEIMRIGESRIKGQQDQIDRIDKELNSANATITKSRVAIKTAERNTKKCRDKVGSLEGEIEEIEKRIEGIKEEMSDIEEKAKEVVGKQEETQETLKQYEESLVNMKAEIDVEEKELQSLNEQLVDLKHEMNQYSAKVKENRQKIKHFQQEINALSLEDKELPELTEEELSLLNKKDVEYQITMLEEELKQMSPNMAAIEEFKRKEALYSERLQELTDVTKERDQVRGEYEGLRSKRLDEFMSGFTIISIKLKEMYQMITLGGDAELELVDSMDPFSEGIVLSVRPPRKSWKNISNLSGGEKTLSSLALVFALHHYKPSPLYVMDEIDAALDFKNVSIVANYIKERTKNAQFIIISLRDNMFELADRLVGIYKTNNCTKTVTINPHKILEKLCGGVATPPTGSSSSLQAPLVQ
ncbi:PREDICTED: structural maintenance of chromosomes protein 4-like [Amphimedon queenslandica]|uniref:Structural maintenance of chromosomes protein 4 n=2 Tax=Amphimedon queenslandica TaxID=400682 RepID=A0A1X7VI42_AMPQE|nr:PREDICTED: structural maintenance of chromosomes protein 4-like [Amphimedon queenslandica]|eukprot:XP_019848995.1 PREDICTED: structural maintenance of chromosomes protein 4-like [Amphimedon queenslandica]